MKTESRFVEMMAEPECIVRVANDSMKKCVVEIEPFGGGSIMMFAGISMHTKTPIVRLQGAVNAVRYQNDILLPLVIPHIRANRGMILAQDNATCYSARTTHQFLRAYNVRLLDWSAKSQDLNPIEHVWDLLKRRVRQLRQHRTLAQLQHDVNQIWRQITQPTIQQTSHFISFPQLVL